MDNDLIRRLKNWGRPHPPTRVMFTRPNTDGHYIQDDCAKAHDLICDLIAERDHLAHTIAAYEELAAKSQQAGGPHVLRRHMELRRLKIQLRDAEVERDALRADLNKAMSALKHINRHWSGSPAAKYAHAARAKLKEAGE